MGPPDTTRLIDGTEGDKRMLPHELIAAASARSDGVKKFLNDEEENIQDENVKEED